MEYATGQAEQATGEGCPACRPRVSANAMRVYREIIRVCRETGGITPSYRGLMHALDMSSTSVVAYHLRRLAAIGLIEMVPSERQGHRIAVVGSTWTPPASAALLCEVPA